LPEIAADFTGRQDEVPIREGRGVDLFSDAAKATRDARRNTARIFLIEGWLPYATSA
jgi:hypothetical protein